MYVIMQEYVEPEDMEGEITLFMGFFLLLFGLPFTCVPFFLLWVEGFQVGLCLFSIPFLLSGLFVQLLGINGIYAHFTGKFLIEIGGSNSVKTTTSSRTISVPYPTYDELQNQIHAQTNAPVQASTQEDAPEAEMRSKEQESGAFWSISDQNETQD